MDEDVTKEEDALPSDGKTGRTLGEDVNKFIDHQIWGEEWLLEGAKAHYADQIRNRKDGECHSPGSPAYSYFDYAFQRHTGLHITRTPAFQKRPDMYRELLMWTGAHPRPSMEEWQKECEKVVHDTFPDGIPEPSSQKSRYTVKTLFSQSVQDGRSNSHTPPSLTSLLLHSYNLLLHGAPGTGKTYLARQVAALVVSEGRTDKPEDLTPEEKDRIGFVQFYPGYDYSNFVEGLKPSDAATSPSGFERRDGVFKKFVDLAAANSEKPFVFIIDEVNRASSSAVFGEVFSLLEPGKRGEYTANLQVSGTPFSLPSNLYIIATMNDIDRSAEPLDFAFRRRWKIVEIGPKDTEDAILDETLPDDEDRRKEAKERMNSLNKAITKEPALGKGYQIGGSYFQRLGDESVFFDDLWREDIEPLLREYLQGEDGAEVIIGRLKGAYNLTPSEGEE